VTDERSAARVQEALVVVAVATAMSIELGRTTGPLLVMAFDVSAQVAALVAGASYFGATIVGAALSLT
jgi:hypothetical protein